MVTDAAVYVADAHGRRLLEADPKTAAIRRIQWLPVGPIYPAVGAGSIWSGSAAVWEDEAAQDDQVVRIDPTTLTRGKERRSNDTSNERLRRSESL